jgi:hypothetical protein
VLVCSVCCGNEFASLQRNESKGEIGAVVMGSKPSNSHSIYSHRAAAPPSVPSRRRLRSIRPAIPCCVPKPNADASLPSAARRHAALAAPVPAYQAHNHVVVSGVLVVPPQDPRLQSGGHPRALLLSAPRPLQADCAHQDWRHHQR